MSTARAARCMGLLLLALVVAPSGSRGDDGAEVGDRAKRPPLPRPTLEDKEDAARYQQGIEALESGKFDDAKKIFRGLRSSVPSGEPRDAVERCYLEATGGLEFQDIDKLVGKGQYRRALAKLPRLLKKYTGTNAGLDLKTLFEQCESELFLMIADFEKKKDSEAADGEGDGGDAGGDTGGDTGGGGRGRGRGQNPGGATGFGANTGWVKGTPEKGEVREGNRALSWRTTRGLSSISFEGAIDKITEYRYLNISIRSEDAKKAPALRVLLDCQDNPIAGWRGGGRGRGGRRGGMRVINREGFFTLVEPTARWQDLRLDLKKFKRTGDVKFEDIVAMRIVHLAGGEGRIIIDNVRLEKE